MTAQASMQDQARLFIEAVEHQKMGRLDNAEKLYREILESTPDHPWVLFSLGAIYHNRGDIKSAHDFYTRAIAIKPDFAEAYNNLAHIMNTTGHVEEANKTLQWAQALKVNNAETYSKIGTAYHARGDMTEAYKYYKAALDLEPQRIPTLNNFAIFCINTGKYDEAERAIQSVLAINPADLHATGHKAALMKQTGDLKGAIEQYQRGLSLNPDYTVFYTNLLLAMVYAPFIKPEEITETAKEFGRRIADPLRRQRPFDNDRSADRKLRIGYVSPDFRDHAVNYFFEHLLRNHNRHEFEVFGYSNTFATDHVTKRLMGQFDHWRDVTNKSDDETADLIESDKIDILIDLAGHTGENRLLVFARKPAPIQASWLGYPSTTGMSAMDYRITDIHTEPEGMTEHLGTEKLWRLPQIFCCYGGHESNPAVIDHTPCEDNGYITFGCFNNFTKISDDVLKAWARIIQQTPNSRLLLEIAGLENEKFIKNVESRIKESGIPIERVTLEPKSKSNQFVLYNRIDIALDPFPCAGGTTSMDTLWMGVPLITLSGRHFISRMGVTILTNAGLQELISDNLDGYISKAVALASDHERLKTIRHNLRQKVEASPMMDQKAFCKNMEDAYHGMWQQYCTAES